MSCSDAHYEDKVTTTAPDTARLRIDPGVMPLLLENRRARNEGSKKTLISAKILHDQIDLILGQARQIEQNPPMRNAILALENAEIWLERAVIRLTL